jgi:hypothetical protein
MKAKWNWCYETVLVAGLVLAGCDGAGNQPTELTEQMQEEGRLMPPTVGGPSEEFALEKKPTDIVPAVEQAFKDAGVQVVRTGSTNQGQWLFGKSLAERGVLVQVLPIYPGRSTVKVTVEGGDALTRELLKRLSSDILQKAHA